MDKIRQEFEAWAKTTPLKNFLFWHPGDSQYEVHAVQTAFNGWKASRAALCIELPGSWIGGEMGDDVDLMATIDIKEALDQSGVSYK